MASRRDAEKAHYETKASLTKAYLELNNSRLRGAPTDRSCSTILPEGLMLSGKDVEEDEMLLRSMGISHVLQVRPSSIYPRFCTNEYAHSICVGRD